MPAGSYSTDVRQGETLRKTFAFLSSGVATDLTGGTFEMALKRKPSDAAVAYTLTPFITVPTPANGTAVLTVPPATTATWTAGRYYYDLKFTDAAAAVSYYLAGTIDVLPAVTP
mgnify:FL=1